ncbi:MAG: tripartite tricarboxylate transporter substrate-binding protein [Pseudomonadota bacterium]
MRWVIEEQRCADTLKGVGIVSTKRSAIVPSVPACSKIGTDNFQASSWVGSCVPTKTNDAIVEKLNVTISEIIVDAIVQDRLADAPPELESFANASAWRRRWRC